MRKTRHDPILQLLRLLTSSRTYLLVYVYVCIIGLYCACCFISVLFSVDNRSFCVIKVWEFFVFVCLCVFAVGNNATVDIFVAKPLWTSLIISLSKLLEAKSLVQKTFNTNLPLRNIVPS